MQKNSQAKTKAKASFKTKTTLIILGFFVFFVLLEIGIRAGGFIFTSLQEYRNQVSIKKRGSYTVLCLGESTTAGQYPEPLEDILNKRNIGIKFSVIDKGIVGIDTSIIYLRLKQNLDYYHPDMVVMMAGCNDDGILYYRDIPEAASGLFQNCRAYRFMRLMYMHIVRKLTEQKMSRSVTLMDTQTDDQNDKAYTELGQFYIKQGKYSQAEEVYKKAIELNPQNDKAYAGLGQVYCAQGEYAKAGELLKKAIELNPQNDEAYIGLGRCYREQDKFFQAEESFKKAIELSPQNYGVYTGLARIYLFQGKHCQAEDLLKKAIELNPQNDKAYTGLGRIYFEQRKYSQAEDSLKKAIEINSRNDKAYGALSVLYDKMGNVKLSKEYADKADMSRFECIPSITVNNYHKFKEILDKRGIRLV